MPYEVRFTKEAKKDIAKLTPKLKQKLKTLVRDTVSINPYAGKKLVRRGLNLPTVRSVSVSLTRARCPHYGC